MYKPQPIDTSPIKLPDDIAQLTELLAENNHDLWARQRIGEGWTYGPERNDANKKHPDLVPYRELPESEKEYDRRTAMETLKTIMALGYGIEGQRKSSVPLPRAEIEKLIEHLQDPAPLDLAALHALWQGRSPERWTSTPEIYRVLGERILKLSEPLMAYDVVTEGLEHWPQDVRLRQLQGLTLARSGATHRARNVFQQLQREGHADEETLGMLARTHKDLWAAATERAEREAYLRCAVEAYSAAYRRTGGYWTGINAATLSSLLGENDRAAALSQEKLEEWGQ